MKNKDSNQESALYGEETDKPKKAILSLKDPRDFARFFFNHLFVRDQLLAAKLAGALTERWARGISDHPYNQVEYLEKNRQGIVAYQDFFYGFFGDYLFKIISDEHYEIISAGTESRYEEIINDLYSKLLNPDNFTVVVERTFASATEVTAKIKSNSRLIKKLLFPNQKHAPTKKENRCFDLCLFHQPTLEDYPLPQIGFSLSDLPELAGNYNFDSVLRAIIDSPKNKWSFYEVGLKTENILPTLQKFVAAFEEFPCKKAQEFIKPIKFEDRVFSHFLSRLQEAAAVFLPPEDRKEEFWSQEEVRDSFPCISEFKIRALLAPLFSRLFNQSPEENRSIFTVYQRPSFHGDEQQEMISLFSALAPDYAGFFTKIISGKAQTSVKQPNFMASRHAQDIYAFYLEYLPSTATLNFVLLEEISIGSEIDEKRDKKHIDPFIFDYTPRLKISVSDGGEKKHSPLTVSFTLFEQTLNAFIDLVYASLSEEEKAQFPPETYPFYRVLVRKKLTALFHAVIKDSKQIFHPDFVRGWEDILRASTTFKKSLSGPVGTVFDHSPFSPPRIEEENTFLPEIEAPEADSLRRIEMIKRALTPEEKELEIYNGINKKPLICRKLLIGFWLLKRSTPETDRKKDSDELFFRDKGKLQYQINFNPFLNGYSLVDISLINFDILLRNFEDIFREFTMVPPDTYAVLANLQASQDLEEKIAKKTALPILTSKEGIPRRYYFLARIIDSLGLQFLNEWSENAFNSEDATALELIKNWRDALAGNDFSLADFTQVTEHSDDESWNWYWKELRSVHGLKSFAKNSAFLQAVLPESFSSFKVNKKTIDNFEATGTSEQKGEIRYIKGAISRLKKKSGKENFFLRNVGGKVHAAQNLDSLTERILNAVCFTPNSPSASAQEFFFTNFEAHAPTLAADFLDREKGQQLVNLLRIIDEDRQLKRDTVNFVLANFFIERVFPLCLDNPAKHNLLVYFLSRFGILEQIYASALDDNHIYHGIAGGSFSIHLWVILKNNTALLKRLQDFLKEFLTDVPLEEIVDDQGQFIIT